MGKFCSTANDCDSLTYCTLSGICCLKVGAPTGVYVVGTGNSVGQVGGAGSSAFTAPSYTAAGGLCYNGTCMTGLECLGAICIPKGGGDIRTGIGGSCSGSLLCGDGLTCVSGLCVATSTGTYMPKGGSCGLHSDCQSACCMGEMCVDHSACTTTIGTGSGGTTTSGSSGSVTTGTPGAVCTQSSSCQVGYYCGRRYSASDPGQCISQGTGQAGQYCEGASSCMPGLICERSTCIAQTTTAGSACILEGSTPSNSCSTDGQCCSNYCGGIGSGTTRNCRAMGSGLEGEVCTMNGNCQPGLECKSVSGSSFKYCQHIVTSN